MDGLTEQVRQLVEQGQAPAPAWVVRVLCETAGAAGQALAERDAARAELERITSQAYELAGLGRSPAYSDRGRTLPELLTLAAQRLADLRRQADEGREARIALLQQLQEAKERMAADATKLAEREAAGDGPGTALGAVGSGSSEMGSE